MGEGFHTEEKTNPQDDKILAAMFIDATVCGRIASIWTGHLFASSTSNKIGSWAVGHYGKYRQAPGRAAMEDYSFAFGQECPDPKAAELVDLRLQGILGNLERLVGGINPDHCLSLAKRHFEKLHLEETVNKAQAELRAGRLDKAQEVMAEYWRKPVCPLDGTKGTDPLRDEEQMLLPTQERSQVLIDYPGAVGEFFGSMLERDSFIAFLAPEKTGKTWWLMDMAIRATLQRRRVAFFEVGDMSNVQWNRRLYTNLLEHPFYTSDGKWPCIVEYPTSLQVLNGVAEVGHEERVFKGSPGFPEIKETCHRTNRERIKSKRQYLKPFYHANSTINVQGIRSILRDEELQGFVPDVVIIDYADILAPPPGKMEVRDQINTTWKQLKALADELHVCLITATQADAESYDRKTLDRRNFSEDKRKLAHVNGLVGINVTSEEKEKGIYRLNWIVRREGKYSTRRTVYAASCLALGQPCVLSCW